LRRSRPRRLGHPGALAELPGALQQGVVDGQENGVTNILDASLYQNQKYVSLDGTSSPGTPK
jgi:TRAP-type C4-dicarboxylate transport system substrate-binding protein